MERFCSFCGEKFKQEHANKKYCSIRCRDNSHKDRKRHGGKRKDLLKELGCICSRCGKGGNSYQIVAHHTTGNKEEHNDQVLLCRSCHAKSHQRDIFENSVFLLCKICEKEFVRRQKKSRTCSANCYKKLYYIEHPEFAEKEAEKARIRARKWRLRNKP